MKLLFGAVFFSFFLLSSFTAGAANGAGDARRASLAPITLLLTRQPSRLDIEELAHTYASWAEGRVATADKTTMMTEADKYTPGGEPPYFSNSGGTTSLVIPSKAAAYYIHGAMAVTGNSRTAALWCFAEAAARNPTNPMFLNNFAFMLMEFEKFYEARFILEYVVKQAPDFLSAQVNLAAARLALGDFGRSGDGFYRAVGLFPQQADYYNLGARAYQLDGQDPAAWTLASLGQQHYQGDYDFTSIINALDFPSSPPVCSLPTSCVFNADCADFMLQGTAPALGEAQSWENNYITNTLDPAFLDTTLNAQHCQQSAADRLQICLANTPQPLTASCHCRSWIEEGYCELVRAQRIFGEENIFRGLLRGRYLAAQGKVRSGLNAIRSKLSSAEFQYLACRIREDFAGILDGVAQDERDTLAVLMQDILAARSNLNTIITSCNQHFSSFELWVFTSGLSVSTEFKHCYGPVCLGYDPTGKFSLSYAFGPAFSFSYDPLKEDWGVAVGLGAQLGVGQWAAGGALVIKAGQGKTGVAITGGALYTSAEQFFGYQRIPAKIFYQ